MALTGTWRFTSIDDLDPVTDVHGRPWLTFDGDGQVYGCTGVNRVRGTWTVEQPDAGAPVLVVGPMASTLMAGPPEAMACEAAVQQLLGVPLTVHEGAGAPTGDATAATGTATGPDTAPDTGPDTVELVAADGRSARLVADPHAGDPAPAAAPAQARDLPAQAEPGHARHVETPAHLPADGPLVVTGAVTYRQRVALPPRSVVTVTVEDTSHADAPARTVGRSVIDAHAHEVPVPFEVVVDRAELDPHTRLALRARIDGPDGLLWVSDTHIPVPLDGSAEPFTVPLVHVTGHPG